jgi:hypothetical protein
LRPSFRAIEVEFRSLQAQFAEHYSCPPELLPNASSGCASAAGRKSPYSHASKLSPKASPHTTQLSNADTYRSRLGTVSASGRPQRPAVTPEARSQASNSRRASEEADEIYGATAMAVASLGDGGGEEEAMADEIYGDTVPSVHGTHVASRPVSDAGTSSRRGARRGSLSGLAVPKSRVSEEDSERQFGLVSEATPDKPVHEKTWLMKTRNKLAVSDVIDLSGFELQNAPEMNLAALEDVTSPKAKFVHCCCANVFRSALQVMRRFQGPAGRGFGGARALQGRGGAGISSGGNSSPTTQVVTTPPAASRSQAQEVVVNVAEEEGIQDEVYA